ncbi:helicase [Phototrophicus methaneseepsis]|uniref:Helicase n=1 Tax=Phototrophicus methaneseepsis TaxID=2710758 RepID=A0A7S8EBF1_9CHLR|nr:helicase-related protein [Phototrophicus methaneseepsis]QPC83764.1 helicase [Phototrophicus methaneseepsis]
MNDLTFFTNEPNASLLDRFKSTLKDVQYFDVLVGYFRTSGFHLLHEALDDIEKIRILVGLSVDRRAYEIIESASGQMELQFEATKVTKEKFSGDVAAEMEVSPDEYVTELSVRKFIELIQQGKLEIKAHPSQKIHAKVYISRFHEDDRDFGRVITGSSNFSYPGLVGQYEFNVELKNRTDVEYALDKFNLLWEEAIDISEEYIDTINKRTWLNDEITPYQIYLKFLYEYFKEDINLDEEFDSYLPDGFLELKYQKQAVISAKKILDSYNGVFLSDVVGLGKTYISALLAQQLPGRKLIICPPVLQDYWRETFFEFNIGGTVVESMGKLDHIIVSGHEKFDYVFVDEAHRFRNEGTQGYEKLHQICWGKKVILVSATPLNNTISDIHAQIKLFQAPKKSTIPGVPNLDRFFSRLQGQIDKEEKGSVEYFETVKAVAKEVRDKVLKYIMVRRTRNEIVNYFADDVSKQGLFFPQLADPQRIIYEFDDTTDAVFNETIEKLKDFKYSRYMPLLYMKRQLSAFEQQSQRNVGGFMKGILVKRLESSFYAFKNTLRRFIESYEKFIDMFDDGTIYISKQVDVYDLLERDNENELLHLVEEDKVTKYPSKDFAATFRDHLLFDLELLREIQDLWSDIIDDPKLNQFIEELRHHNLLKGKKVIIFTESSETAEYLYENLESEFSGKVLEFSSSGGMMRGTSISKPVARSMILDNYDPRQRNKKNDIRILITTDVLAEGVNLHRSNIVINYDLPWNPTRVLQRVGRVNRVGTDHQNVYIFNFFPTAQSSRHLNLEDNVKTKIQAFHDMLGEDARYLTDEEAVTQHELFGDRLYKRLNTKETYEGETEERSELEYLQEIRDIRDKHPELFEKIKRLPKKARTGRKLSETNTRLEIIAQEQVVTFFRKGMLKKFFLASKQGTLELPFLEAVDLLKVEDKGEKENKKARIAVPRQFYDLLQQNKEAFTSAVSTADDDLKPAKGGRSNEAIVIKLLKQLDRTERLTDDDEAYLKVVLNAFEMGIIPSKTSKSIKDTIEKERTLDAVRILTVLRTTVPDNILYVQADTKQSNQPNEVILSAYLLAQSV